MASVVKVRSYWKDEARTFQGPALRYHNYIITHYKSIGLEKISLENCSMESISILPIEVFLLVSRASSQGVCKESLEPISITNVWRCQTFRYFFDSFFRVEDFGDDSVPFSATFVILTLKERNTKENVRARKSGEKSGCELEVGGSVSQGMRVSLINESLSPFDKWNMAHMKVPMKPNLMYQKGLVSYVYEERPFFSIDIAIGRREEGSILYREENTHTASLLGMIIFQDDVHYPFEVFPLCITIKHLTWEQCHNRLCLQQSPLHQTPSNHLSKNQLRFEYLVLMECGSQMGSGFLISEAIVMTCSHILAEHRKCGVSIWKDGRMYMGQVIYEPPSRHYWPDLALIQIKSYNSSSAIAQFSDKLLSIGDMIFAAGIPYIKGTYKKEPWVSSGNVVSSDKKGCLIGTCAVHSGFSGGCALDTSGHVVGMICGKAYPLNKSSHPLRLTQIISTFHLRHHLIKFIATHRNQSDIDDLNEKLLKCIRSNIISRL